MKLQVFPTSYFDPKNGILPSEVRSKLISGAVISFCFYTFQLLFQAAFKGLRVHAGLPRLITLSVGCAATTISLCLSQLAELELREKTNLYTTSYNLYKTSRRPLFPMSTERVSDQLSRLLLGLGFFVLLEQSLFRTAFPSSVIRPGVYANFLNRHHRSIIATSDIVREVERRRIQTLGRLFGCHHCGDRQWFSSKGFIADHMPPTKFANEMSKKGLRKLFNFPVKQRLWPQCNKCFLLQGAAVRVNQDRLVFHGLFRRHHLAPALAIFAMQQPDVAETLKETTKPVTKSIQRFLRRYSGRKSCISLST